MSDLGSGPSLDSNLDFVVDETGDLGFSEGLSELEKDLAFRMIQSFDTASGGLNRPSYMKDVELYAAKVARADPRVEEVIRVNARPISREGIEIVLELSVNGEDVEAVIEL